MTPKLWVRIAASVVAASGAILAIGDKIIAMPGLPGDLVNAWPLVMFAAILTNQVGAAIIEGLKEKSDKETLVNEGKKE